MRYLKYPFFWLFFLFCTVLFHDFAIQSLVATFMYHDFEFHLYVKCALYFACLAITGFPLVLCFDQLGNSLNKSPLPIYPLYLAIIQQSVCTGIYIFSVIASGFHQRLSYSIYLFLWAVEDMDRNAVTAENQKTWLICVLIFQALLFTALSTIPYYAARKKQLKIRELERLHSEEQTTEGEQIG